MTGIGGCDHTAFQIQDPQPDGDKHIAEITFHQFVIDLRKNVRRSHPRLCLIPDHTER